MGKEIKTKLFSSDNEINHRENFIETFKNSPIPDNEILQQLGLYMNRQSLSRVLFFHELYKQIINVHGVIMEFGIRWGQTLALMQSLRGIYEPYNFSRKILGFDTFSGFPSVDEKDGDSDIVEEGAYSVTENYEDYLESVLQYHETESPLSHMKKFDLIKGDASVTIEQYLKDHPETIIAFAYFDFDIYEPTKKGLEAIKDHLTKGSIIGFDELSLSEFPGETIALKEVFGLSKYSIKRFPMIPYSSYIVIE